MSLADLDAATAGLEPPFAVLDLTALRSNAADLVRRAGGVPIRIATKSVRARAVLDLVLAIDGFRGVMAYTLPEALWLAGPGGDDAPPLTDILVGYPTADRAALRRLARDEALCRSVTLMVDSVEQLDLVDDALRHARSSLPLRICLDLDVSWRPLQGRVYVGVRRSPVRDPAGAAGLARAVAARADRFTLVGVMAYEAQIAGVGNAPPRHPVRGFAVRAMQRASAGELVPRRAAMVAAVRAFADLEFANGGGTGSVDATAADPSCTEVTAGSGLYGPALFDAYRGFRPKPAALFALPVVRRPGPGVVTCMGGGWVASGAIGPDRLPTPVWPPGLTLVRSEGAGEVQTPVCGAAADLLRVGDRVWFRHAKAGELCERVDQLHLLDTCASGDLEVVGEITTYRGAGTAFA